MARLALPAAPAAWQRPQRAACIAPAVGRATPQQRRQRRRHFAAVAADGNGKGGGGGKGDGSPPPALHPNLLAEETLLSEDEALNDKRGGGIEEGAAWPAAAPAAAADELSSVRAEVSELRSLLAAQAQLVQSQQRHIEALQQSVVPAAAAAADGGARSVLLDSMDKEQSARASRAAAEATLHDRRPLGLYDARFHSTSW